MKKTLAAIGLTLSVLIAAPVSAEESPMVQVNRLTLASAQQIAQAAIEACRERGIQIGVTVVDRDGTVQAALRDTIAAPITLPISKGKAFTAVNFNAATSAMAERANTAVGRQPGLVMSAGGLPIQTGGALVGGVGVSGAPAGETDEECAQAGIDAIMMDLELGM